MPCKELSPFLQVPKECPPRGHAHLSRHGLWGGEVTTLEVTMESLGNTLLLFHIKHTE